MRKEFYSCFTTTTVHNLFWVKVAERPPKAGIVLPAGDLGASQLNQAMSASKDGQKRARAKRFPEAVPGPARAKILRLFISYAREDEKIAVAVSNAIKAALSEGSLFDVSLDQYSFEIGSDLQEQIQRRLEDTDRLIVIYTGVDKPSHSYTGWEVGYFMGVQQRLEPADDSPKIVSLYLNNPPAVIAHILGIGLGINRENLLLSEEDYAKKLTETINEGHGAVRFFEDLQATVDDYRAQSGMGRAQRADTKKCVRDMLFSIFCYLKTTIDKTLKPQKQIIVKTDSASLEATDNSLPDTAQLTPVGSGSSMAIFGLPDATLTWQEFVSQVSEHKLGSSWCEAITRVITSSLPNQIEIDNSQVIISSDEGHVYRLILTTSATYFNGHREFNLYLVEALRPKDYGDKATTRLLNGLEIVCRFRFMFLEERSEFSQANVLAIRLERVPDLARDLLRELNLLRRDAQEAGLDQPSFWSAYVSWEVVLAMGRNWAPNEVKLRATLAKLLTLKRASAPSNELSALRGELAQTLEAVRKSTRTHNQLLITEMTSKLKSMIEIDGGGTGNRERGSGGKRGKRPVPEPR